MQVILQYNLAVKIGILINTFEYKNKVEFATKNRATLPQFSIKTTIKAAQNPIIDRHSLVGTKIRRNLGPKIGVTLPQLSVDWLKA